jgi:CMP-N-acetylneuraminic acid synthetase
MSNEKKTLSECSTKRPTELAENSFRRLMVCNEDYRIDLDMKIILYYATEPFLDKYSITKIYETL